MDGESVQAGQVPVTTQTDAKSNVSLLDKIVEDSHLGHNEEERRVGKDWVQAFLKEVETDKIRVSSDLDSMLSRRIAELDTLLSDQLNEILHDDQFKHLEATWRGLDYLTKQTETSPMLKIKVFNAPKK